MQPSNYIQSLTLNLLAASLSSADKQFKPRSGPTECRPWSGLKSFRTLIVFPESLLLSFCFVFVCLFFCCFFFVVVFCLFVFWINYQALPRKRHSRL